MQRLSRIGRNTLAVSVSTLLLSACNQGDDAPKPAAVAPQPAAPSMAALSIPLCLNGQCAVIDQDAKLLVPFDNDYDNIVASAYQGTLMAAREERWNLIQAKDGKVLRDDIGEALSLLTPNLYGFVRDGKYGVVDGQGKEVQAPRFDDIYPTVPTNSSSTRSMASAASSMPRASSSPRRSTTPPWSTAASPNTAA